MARGPPASARKKCPALSIFHEKCPGLSIFTKKCPGLSLEVFAASDWSSDEDVLIECKKSIENARLIFVSMLFMEGHFKPILEDLKARRDKLDALICIMSSPEVTRLTRMGRLDMSKPASGVMSFLIDIF